MLLVSLELLSFSHFLRGWIVKCIETTPIHQRRESGLPLFCFIFLLLQVFNVNGFGGLEDALDKVRDVLVDKNSNIKEIGLWKSSLLTFLYFFSLY